jgi:DNA-binding transcriptional MerR regulator
MEEPGVPRVRIGELSRRVEVPTTVLRAWERRYGLLRPERSEGNFRLYSLDDVARVWAMKAHLARGHAAAEAARLALAEDLGTLRGGAAGEAGPAVDELRVALTRFDEAGAQRVLDRALALDPLEQVLGELVLPCLRGIGEEWERGEVGVAQEHFASTLLRSRLLALSQGWNSGTGPAAALACPPGELHDIGLICFGLALWRRGWRIFYIGQDTPVDQLRKIAAELQLSLLVVAAHSPELFRQPAQELRELAGEAHLAIAGAGATPEVAAELRATALGGDAIAAAAAIAAGEAAPA